MKTRKLVLWPLFALSLSLTACGGEAPSAPVAPGGADGPVPTGPTVGVEPVPSSSSPAAPAPQVAPTNGPRLTASKPASGATGVAADAVIFLAFDRAMDRAAVEAAYTSTSLPAAEVTFTWNAAGDQLTIGPKEKLAYAEGDPSVVAKKYDVQIGAGARDLAGRSLEPFSIGFSTLRRVGEKLAPDLVRSGWVTANTPPGPGAGLVGDAMLKGIESQVKTVLTFSLAAIPPGVELELAYLRMEEAQLSGAPDVTLGSVTAAHLGAIDALQPSTFSMAAKSTKPVTRFPGGNGLAPVRSSTVTAMVASDLANRAALDGRSSFRIAYAVATDGDGAPDGFELGLTTMNVYYLAP